MFGDLFGKKNIAGPLAKIDYTQFFTAQQIDGIAVEQLPVGKLHLASGKIVAADPLVYLSVSLPFIKTVKPGDYDVIVSVASTEDMGERYAAVMVKFSDQLPVKWEMALTDENDINDLKHEDDYFGFPVDAGLGCFCDSRAQEAYIQFVREFYASHPQDNIYDDFFDPAFKANAKDPSDPHDIGDWLNFAVPGAENQKHNVVMFHSGFGDGYYPCYWGIDAQGEICSLVVDFMVFGSPPADPIK
ncbi:DUF4241 domain-containing protein [Acetonema longum]|uniref:DUF4241 domain-containing protein n=1 Tax=Acetonema longum DSM 6540 TaxID=1009370 RepID=F7NGS1_9FIRM|nr:DUF4241 domain-containing protein [Acetonema longum]EGO64652.1 hypothetical protein ALO_06303 [Acetonema longum DSM 6540]